MTGIDQDPNPTTATCLWCGADRPVDVDICPTCEHAWIDATIDEAREGKLDSVIVPAPSPPTQRRRRWIPLALAAAVAAVYGIVFWIMWDNTNDSPAAVATTAPPATVTSAPPVSTSSSTSAAPSATTAPPTTTTTTTTTTSTTTLPPIAIVEPPFDPSELTLGAFALGPIPLGAIDPDLPGRLAATFGQPSGRFEVGENWGMCPTEQARVLEFDHLALILRSEPDGESFAGFRVRWSERDRAPTEPTGSLRTISGLGLTDTLSRARQLYSNVVTAEDDAGTPLYLVLRSSDGRTLLWGELSDDADPLVLSINSPRPCDGGPFAP